MDESARYPPGAAAARPSDAPRRAPVVRRSLNMPAVVALGKAVHRKGRMKAKRPPPPSSAAQTGSCRAADLALALDGGALREAPSDPHADTLSHLPGGPANTTALDQVDTAIEMELQALEELKARREAARRRLLRQQQQGPESTGLSHPDVAALRRQSWSGNVDMASGPPSTAAPQPAVANDTAARRRGSSPHHHLVQQQQQRTAHPAAPHHPDWRRGCSASARHERASPAIYQPACARRDERRHPDQHQATAAKTAPSARGLGDCAENANGDTYYVDHVNKITSWEHPASQLSEAAQEFFEGTAL